MTNRCTYCGTGDWCNCELEHRAKMAERAQCARKCVEWRQHTNECPVNDRQAGAWVPLAGSEEDRDLLFDADLHTVTPGAASRETAWIGRYGGLEEWHACDGCKPRPATNGALCEPCALRLADMMAVGRQKLGDRTFLIPGQGSIAWAHARLAGFLQPSQQVAGDKVGGSKVPPAPIALGNVDLRDDLAEYLGRWLTVVCDLRGLRGPDWWQQQQAETRRRRDARADSWRPLLPRTQLEVTSAQAFLSGWIGELIRDADRARQLYTEASDLLARVKRVAPWQVERRRMPGLTCPKCERDALVMEDGSENLKCRRCREVVKRDRYDRWAELASFERQVAV